METCSHVRFHQLRPSPKSGRVGSCINVFEACSTFTHVTACMLAESPSRPSAPEASAVSLPPCCSDCYRVERTSSRAGLLPLWTTAFHDAPDFPVKLALYHAIAAHFQCVDQSKNVGLLRALHDVSTVEEYAPTFAAACCSTDSLCVRRSVFRCTHGR